MPPYSDIGRLRRQLLGGLCLLGLACVALLGLASAGCTAVDPATGRAELRPPTPAEVQVWDRLLAQSVAAVRTAVAAQPAGPRRDELLRSIDAVTTWGSLASVVAEAAAAGFELSRALPATQPSTQIPGPAAAATSSAAGNSS